MNDIDLIVAALAVVFALGILVGVNCEKIDSLKRELEKQKSQTGKP